MSANTFRLDRRPSITRRVVEEYEKIRTLGVCNMADRQSVLKQARLNGCTHLAEIIEVDNLMGSNDYTHLLTNYVFYMREFGLL